MTKPNDDHMSRTAQRVEIFTGAGRRRDWSAAQKAAIVAESYCGTVSVCDVARRHGLTPTQLFTWRRLARRNGDADKAPFAPVVIEPLVAEPAALASHSIPPAARPHPPSPVIELDVGGANVWIWRDAPVGMVTAIIGALKAGS
jgi:transposase